MDTPRGWRVVLIRTVGAALMACLSACMPADAPEPKPMVLDPKGSTPVSMRGYNYTDEGVQAFYVNGSWVSNLPEHGGGGADSCCALLANRWHEGMTVEVDWTMGRYTVPWSQRNHLSFEEQGRYWNERRLHQTVPVQRYERPNTLQVFFLPDDKVEVWVSSYDLGHPDHPSGRRYPMKPPKPIASPQPPSASASDAPHRKDMP